MSEPESPRANGPPAVELAAKNAPGGENLVSDCGSRESQERQAGLAPVAQTDEERASMLQPEAQPKQPKGQPEQPEARPSSSESPIDTASQSSPAPSPSSSPALSSSSIPALPGSPQPPCDIQVRLNDNPALGFCVFAMRRYEPGEILYTENKALEATHDVFKEGPRLVYDAYRHLSATKKAKLHGAFPYLAWANNVDPFEAAECRHLIASNIVKKNAPRVDIKLSAEDHILMRPDSALYIKQGQPGPPGHAVPPPQEPDTGYSFSPSALLESSVAAVAGLLKWSVYGTVPEALGADALADGIISGTNTMPPPTSTKMRRIETVGWFSRYAFRVPPEHAFPNKGKLRQAAVYLLTDLINHRCNRFQNCKVRTDVNTMTLIAEKVILPGEEITIDYLKDKKDFACRADCCAPKSSASPQ